MKVFLRYFAFCALFLAFLSFARHYTSDTDYALIEKEVVTGGTSAMHDLEYFRQEHEGDSHAMLFYHIMRARLLTKEGTGVSMDSVEAWVAQSKQTGDSLLYAKSLETLAACHAIRGGLPQALSAQQRAGEITRHAEADSASRHHHILAAMAVILCIVSALCMTFLHFHLRGKTEKRHAERRLALAKEQQKLSEQNANQFLAAIQELRRIVAEERAASSQVTLSEIGERMSNEMCSFQKQQVSLALAALSSSDIAERFRKSATDRRIKISEKDWNALTELFSQHLPQLITILQTNGMVSASERRVCMLTLLDLGTLETASILNLQRSSVSSAKRSLLVKLTGNASSSAKELNTAIISLIATT